MEENKIAEQIVSTGDAMQVVLTPGGVRKICGYEILDTLGKGMSGK